VFAADEAVGEVTRAAESPTLDRPVALAYVDFDRVDVDSVRVDGTETAAAVTPLPFVEGSDDSARLPVYEF